MSVDEKQNDIHNSDEIFNELICKAKNHNKKEETSGELLSDQQLISPSDFVEEKLRSETITEILGDYRGAYNNKVVFQSKYRKYLFWGCSAYTTIFVIAIIFIIVYTALNSSTFNISDVIPLITIIISLVVSILELVHIITKYCFPENDEEYIVKIVESIHAKDLEKYLEQVRNQNNQKKSK